jgi:hypothetical protein
MWGAAFVSGCISTLLMSRTGPRKGPDLNQRSLAR